MASVALRPGFGPLSKSLIGIGNLKEVMLAASIPQNKGHVAALIQLWPYKEVFTMASETLREKHPNMKRPHMADGSLVDRGEDPGPGKDPKAQEIDTMKSADTDAYRARVAKTRLGGKDPSAVKIEALRADQARAKTKKEAKDG